MVYTVFCIFFSPNESSELKYGFHNRGAEWPFAAEENILKVNVFRMEMGNEDLNFIHSGDHGTKLSLSVSQSQL